MNKEDALKAVNEAPDRADIIVAIFPLTECERCKKAREVLYNEWDAKEEKYREICGACKLDIKMAITAKNKIEREKKRCINLKKSRKKSIDASKQREELLKSAVFV